MTISVGVLALQGAVREHLHMIKSCNARGIAIKKPAELSRVDALIIPGGESTTIGKLIVKYGFITPIKELYRKGVPLYGTCAGLILLASRVSKFPEAAGKDNSNGASKLPLMGLMDMEVRRNAYGRQRESFEAHLDIPKLGNQPFEGVFIRAPLIESVGSQVEVLARFEGKIVMAQAGRIVVTAFHPELTNDMRIHKYFLKMIEAVDCQQTKAN